MADQISKDSWTRFTKKHALKLDDSALIKALEKLDKTPEKNPEARADASGHVADVLKKQVPLLTKQKKELGDKVFNLVKDQIYQLLDQAETLQKAMIQAAKEAAKEAARKEADADEDEEKESPALLTTAMVPLVRMLQKGDVQMHALIAVAGKRAALLISKRTISPSRRKLLTEYLGNPGGVKFIAADVAGSKGMLEFLLESSASGLSPKLRAALLEQTGFRMKVFIQHGEETETDGDDDEVDDVDGEAPAPADVAAAAQKAYQAKLAKLLPQANQALKKLHPEATKIRALLGFASEKADEAGDYAAASKALDALAKLLQAGNGNSAANPGAGNKPDGEATAKNPAADFTARLAKLMPAIKEAIAAGGPDSQDLKLKASEAGTLARRGDLAAANRLLKELEATLGAADAPEDDADAEQGDDTPKEKPSFVGYAKARLSWIDARKKVSSDLKKLEKAILDAYQGSDVFKEAQAATRQLDAVLKTLDEALADKLDEGLNAADDATRSRINKQASDLIAKYLRFIHTNPLMAEIDDNPFVPLNTQEELSSMLRDLDRQLS